MTKKHVSRPLSLQKGDFLFIDTTSRKKDNLIVVLIMRPNKKELLNITVDICTTLTLVVAFSKPINMAIDSDVELVIIALSRRLNAKIQYDRKRVDPNQKDFTKIPFNTYYHQAIAV